jgi:large subunit ribosomal protein L3
VDRVTVKNLKVIRIDKERNLLLVRGAVPGAVGAALMLHKSKTAQAKGR